MFHHLLKSKVHRACVARSTKVGSMPVTAGPKHRVAVPALEA